jgi:hypothetical protein
MAAFANFKHFEKGECIGCHAGAVCETNGAREFRTMVDAPDNWLNLQTAIVPVSVPGHRSMRDMRRNNFVALTRQG